MQRDDTDVRLVEAARDGDKGAFAVLFERHRPMLAALCRRALRDANRLEDAVQEAALQALLNLDYLRRPEQFGPWLGGIGLNVCRRMLRERSRDSWSWEALWGGRLIREPIDWGPSPEELAEARDLAERVRRAVAELPRGQRAAVLLFYLSGLTHAEVAAHLGIEVSAVKQRLHRARATLRRRIWAEWKEEEMTTRASVQPVEVRVAEVRLQPGGQRVVVLHEVHGDRLLPIWVGNHEGDAIAMHLQKVEAPRPMTYAFMADLLRAASVRLREVVISALADDVFYAVAVVSGQRGSANVVDARPSDAINLALATGAPIYVENAVLETAKITPVDTPEGATDIVSAAIEQRLKKQKQ